MLSYPCRVSPRHHLWICRQVTPIFSLAVSSSANRIACGTRFQVVVFTVDVNLLHNQSGSEEDVVMTSSRRGLP